MNWLQTPDGTRHLWPDEQPEQPADPIWTAACPVSAARSELADNVEGPLCPDCLVALGAMLPTQQWRW